MRPRSILPIIVTITIATNDVNTLTGWILVRIKYWYTWTSLLPTSAKDKDRVKSVFYYFQFAFESGWHWAATQCTFRSRFSFLFFIFLIIFCWYFKAFCVNCVLFQTSLQITKDVTTINSGDMTKLMDNFAGMTVEICTGVCAGLR